MKEIIYGLEYLHSKNIAHGDIKPENIYFDQEFNIKLNNFESTNYIHMENREFPLKVGTKRYLAPEVLLGLPYSLESVDIFA